MVQWNHELLHRFLAPGIGEFTEADIPEIDAMHPEARHWIANHFLNSTLRGMYRPQVKPVVLNILFRAQTAFHYYNEARSKTLQFLERAQPGNPSSGAYFSAVAAWEAVVLNTQWAQEVTTQSTKTKMFEPGDGSDDERLWKIASTIKHCGSHIASGLHGEELTVPLWLTNDGLTTRDAQLSYQEMAVHVGALAGLADTLQDPISAAEKNAARLRETLKESAAE